MASTKSSRTAKQSGSRGKQKTRAKATSRRKPAAPRRRRASKAKPPSTQEKLVQAVRSVKPGIAAGAAASVVGGVALAVRSRRSNGFDARGLAKRFGKTTKSLGKTSKELGKEMQRLGDDAENVGKTLS
jgi:hypothetical protein